jgi:hypothetical protein
VQFLPQGPKLVGTGATGPASDQGLSIALSGDGNTAILGSPADNSGVGAAWVFYRNAGVWAQHGQKLVGTGAVGPATQGTSVALSLDGQTAIVGGKADNHSVGAAWVFTRGVVNVWTQQSKLVGTDAVGAAGQGTSVALSASADTIIVGGSEDNGGVGAAWVFVRGGSASGSYVQQGPKLVGTVTGAYPQSKQGCVALSADGTTAIVGGPADNQGAGAAWVFTLSGTVWAQQSKLVGTGAFGGAFGSSVALSADGNTAIVGGWADYYWAVGAAWVFTRSGSVWTQGSKLVGAGALSARQGWSVALSADGNTAIVGGPADNGGAGAAWVFTRSGDTWTQGSKLFATDAVGAAGQGWSVAISIDGNTAIVGGPTDGSGGAAWVYVRQ